MARSKKPSMRLRFSFHAAMLPPPTALVCSGGGWHVYWITDKALTEAEWRPYAEGLWALAQKHGLRADAGVTTDSVRVLRIPGTFNMKAAEPRLVKLVALAPADYDFESSLRAYKGRSRYHFIDPLRERKIPIFAI